jgi:HD superfamily phosphodiesterase
MCRRMKDYLNYYNTSKITMNSSTDLFEEYSNILKNDASHDLCHIRRVLNNARKIAKEEKVDEKTTFVILH